MAARWQSHPPGWNCYKPLVTKMLDSESYLIQRFSDLKKSAEAVGITLLAEGDKFVIKDARKATGQICFDKLEDMATFIYGYELGYKAGL